MSLLQIETVKYILKWTFSCYAHLIWFFIHCLVLVHSSGQIALRLILSEQGLSTVYKYCFYYYYYYYYYYSMENSAEPDLLGINVAFSIQRITSNCWQVWFIWNIAWSAEKSTGWKIDFRRLHYNQSVSPTVRVHLAKLVITLEPSGICS